jgi:hypothetical protein
MQQDTLFAPARKRRPITSLATTLEYEPPPSPPPPPPPPAIDDTPLLAILDAPLHTGETAAAGFARKERELAAVFAQLPVLAARGLHMRLANPRRDDQLADKFARLTIERRTRLLNFLADARRRAALTSR